MPSGYVIRGALLGVVLLLGCSPAPALGPVDTPAPEPVPSPFLDVPSRAPATPTPSPSPSATPTVRPSGSPSASPSPVPTATPHRYESHSFFFTVPSGWTIALDSLAPEHAVLHSADGGGTFEVMTLVNGQTLKQFQASEASVAGQGLVSNSSTTLDLVPGFVLIANQDTTDGGKVFLTERGFIYRGLCFTLKSSWDKRSSNATAVEKEVSTMVQSFKWL